MMNKRKSFGKIATLQRELENRTLTQTNSRVSKSKVQRGQFDHGEAIQLSVPATLQEEETRALSFQPDSMSNVSSFGTAEPIYSAKKSKTTKTHQDCDEFEDEVDEELMFLREEEEKEKEQEAPEAKAKSAVDLFNDDLEEIVARSKELDAEVQKPAPQPAPAQKTEELSIFDKLDKANAMTYNLGTIDISSAFEEFDEEMDIEEIERTHRKQKQKQEALSVFEEAEEVEEDEPSAGLSLPGVGGVVYDTRGNRLGRTLQPGSEVVIIMDRKFARSIGKANRRAEKNKQPIAPIDLTKVDREDYFILPPKSHRDTIRTIMENDTTNGHQEFGGRGLIHINTSAEPPVLDTTQFVHMRAEDGTPAGPDDNAATIRLQTIHQEERAGLAEKLPSGFFATDYTWHSHPGGVWKKAKEEDPWMTEEEFSRQKFNNEPGGSVTVIGGSSEITKSYNLGPSEKDIRNAHSRYEESVNEPISGTQDVKHEMKDNFVIHKKEGWVFYYNHNTPIEEGAYESKIRLDLFYALNGED